MPELHQEGGGGDGGLEIEEGVPAGGAAGGRRV